MRRGEHVVVVGAGAGGFMAAHTLHQHGFAGTLTLADPDHAAPYERPMLSKKFLGGEIAAAETGLGGKNWAKKNRIKRRYSRAIGTRPGDLQPNPHQSRSSAASTLPRSSDMRDT